MGESPFDNALSALIWRRRYRSDDDAESSLEATWQRVAGAVAKAETDRRAFWTGRFLAMLDGFRFLPAGRILANAGTGTGATLFNCFVMGRIEDSIASIFERLRESALTMQQGGGIGCDFSRLRPAGSVARSSGRTASGPVSFLHLWDAMCATLLSRGNRRGAMMGVLRCDHPDILEFIDAKRTPGALTNFNLSVLVTDRFMTAVDRGLDWTLLFPPAEIRGNLHGATLGVTSVEPSPRSLHATIAADALWQGIVDAAYAAAEPGVLFVDRINACNNLHYCESITATNPCGEVPLPPNGACNLGSINLAAHVESPFTPRARLDLDAIGALTADAVRFLDNVVDISPFPLPAQAAEARATRRIGLGITGLADALIMLGQRYDSEAGRETARRAMTRIRDAAYRASIALAREKGSFPGLDRDAYLAGRYVAALPGEIRDDIALHGIRNSHLLAVAPAGTISVLANNLSSGIEPVFAARMERRVRSDGGEEVRHTVVDHACAAWARAGGASRADPDALVCAAEIAPEDHLLMAAAVQALVDNSVSKTVNVSADITPEAFGAIYRRAYELGLKGCTVYRANPVRGAVLAEATANPAAIHCCAPEREGD